MNTQAVGKIGAAILIFLLAVLWSGASARAQQKYEKPPREVLDVLNAPLAACDHPEPQTRHAAAGPAGRLSGHCRSGRTDAAPGRHPDQPAHQRRTQLYLLLTALTLKRIPDGPRRRSSCPHASGAWAAPLGTAAGTMFAFTNEAAERRRTLGVRRRHSKARPVQGVRLNPLLGRCCPMAARPEDAAGQDGPDRPRRAPEPPPAPPGPKVQESPGVVAASSTYEVRDVLKNPHDADLFDYYADFPAGPGRAAHRRGHADRQARRLLRGLLRRREARYLLVERIRRPYSYLRGLFPVSQGGRGVDDGRKARRDAGEPSPGRTGPDRGRADGAPRPHAGARPSRRRWFGSRRWTAAIPRPRRRTATA